MGNERLLWMFPDLVWPLRALDNKHQRCKSQTYNGQPTRTQWTASKIVFPNIAGIPGSGSVLVALPLISCRGANHTTPDGEVLRPDLVIFDDVQSDEDAKNPNTVTKIEELIDHTAMMLGGHSQTMSAIMNCTVRVADDLSDRYLSKSGWRRVRYKMLASKSKAEDRFWFGEYAEARKTYDPDDADDQDRAHREALALYKRKRKAADAGAEVTWEWAFAWKDENPTEISAIQHAYNIAIDLGPNVFASECQNAPVTAAEDLDLLSISAIAKKVTNYPRGAVPSDCTIVTAFTDVQKDHLFWMVCAWSPDFTGYVIDYGAWPEQKTAYFTRRTIGRKLSKTYAGDDSAIMWAALVELEAKLFGAPYKTTDGRELNISRWCIDGGYAVRAPVTMAFAKQSKYAGSISLTKGVYYGAKHNPMSFSERSKKYRTQLLHWQWQAGPGNAQWVNFDTNFWKKRTHESLTMPIASRGGIQLFKATPQAHLMLAEHLRSEKPVKVEANGRTVYEWTEIPGRDNEGLDCLVGCFVAASIAGVSRATERIVIKSKSKPRKRVSYLEV